MPKQMPNELKDWIIQNYKDCEDGKLGVIKKMLFLDLVEENKWNKDFQNAFNEFEKSKVLKSS